MNSHLRMLAGALALVLTVAGAARADQAPAPGRNCFLSNQWKNWSVPASGKGDVLYLRLNNNDIYRVDLAPGSGARRGANEFLINRVRGSNWICSAVDLDLSIGDNLGFHRPLIARSLRRLTPDEIAAIPRHERP
jgi:hypothetical protein